MGNNLPPSAYRPAYVRQIVFVGGAFGNDVDAATANATMDYAPRYQYGRSQQQGNALVDDVGKDYGEFAGEMTRTGTVEPFMPYPTGGVAPPEPPDPVVTAVNPNTAEAGSPDLPITLTGTGFVDGAEIMFGATAVFTTFVSATSLNGVIGAALLAAEGTFPVGVRQNGEIASSGVPFTVTPAVVT